MAPGPHTCEAAWWTGSLGVIQLPQGASALPTAKKEGHCGAQAAEAPAGSGLASRTGADGVGSPGGVLPRPFLKHRLPSPLEASPFYRSDPARTHLRAERDLPPPSGICPERTREDLS